MNDQYDDYGIRADGSTASAVRAVHGFREQGAIVRDDVRELARTAKSTVRELAGEARSRASTGIQKGKESLSGARKRAGVYLSENPYKSVLAGLSVGALLGAFLFRRR